ncbi:MAG TPA: MarR family transcriptional regulator [Firmicutes bacterium]|nr:MarR family transcriptional regulator [Bacillota bacterium]
MRSLHRNLSILSHALHRIVVPESLRHPGPRGLSKQQYELMHYIRNHPATHPGKLAKAFAISAPTVSTMLQRLEQKGYIEKIPHPDDQRAVNINITPSGAARLEAVEEERHALIERLLEPLTQHELDTLGEGVAALMRAIATTQDRNLICVHCDNVRSTRCLVVQGLTCAHVTESL